MVVAMKVITSPRQGGKTTKLIEMATEMEANGAVVYIVTPTRKDASHVYKHAERMGINLRQPITFDDLRTGLGKWVTHLLIDDLDRYIQSLTSVRIAAVTLNEDEDPALATSGLTRACNGCDHREPVPLSEVHSTTKHCPGCGIMDWRILRQAQEDPR